MSVVTASEMSKRVAPLEVSNWFQQKQPFGNGSYKEQSTIDDHRFVLQGRLFALRNALCRVPPERLFNELTSFFEESAQSSQFAFTKTFHIRFNIGVAISYSDSLQPEHVIQRCFRNLVLAVHSQSLNTSARLVARRKRGRFIKTSSNVDVEHLQRQHGGTSREFKNWLNEGVMWSLYYKIPL